MGGTYLEVGLGAEDHLYSEEGTSLEYREV
jgi:hypothetical protein